MKPPSFMPRPKPEQSKGQDSVNAMTVDVEDYFQVHALAPYYPRDSWDDIPLRVGDCTERLLDLFAEFNTQATFFTLGWVAERYPDLMRKIVDQGHELASHGMDHTRADHQSPDEFREDIATSKKILEDLTGCEVLGFRAASFSIGKTNLWAFDILGEEGYHYSSSINPVRHDHYGMPDAPRFPFYPTGSPKLEELPISTLSVMGHNMPCGGGGYFRLLPYAYAKFAIGRVNTHDGWPFMFYFHPWEIDPDQPRPDKVNLKSKLRHYTNLTRMEQRLRRLLTDFSWDRVDRTFLDHCVKSD